MQVNEDFKIRRPEDVVSSIPSRKNRINNLSKVPVKHVLYSTYLSNHISYSLGADIELMDYESTIQANNYITSRFPQTSNSMQQFSLSVRSF